MRFPGQYFDAETGFHYNFGAGEPAGWGPRLDVSALGVMAGPYRDGAEHEKHALAALGSGDWYRPPYDELLFDAESKVLASLWSHLPEARLEHPAPLSAWTSLAPEPSSLRLIEPARFLTTGWALPSREAAEPGVAALLAEVFDTVVEPDIELMEDEDAGMLERLRALEARIAARAGDTRRGRNLREHVAALIGTFYG